MATMTSLKVLVVDDDPTVRDVLRIMLGFEGCQVVDAPDGESALVMFAAIRPDVVILDVAMPGMDGVEVCRQLKTRPHPPRVVMLTARVHPEDERRALDAGADAYIRKPFSPLEVLELVGVPMDGDRW
jgi:two-component system OmpR family response regulator